MHCRAATMIAAVDHLRAVRAMQKASEIKREYLAMAGLASPVAGEGQALNTQKYALNGPLAAKTSGRLWKKLRLLTPGDRRNCRTHGRSFLRVQTWGYSGCRFVSGQLQRRRCHLLRSPPVAWLRRRI